MLARAKAVEAGQLADVASRSHKTFSGSRRDVSKKTVLSFLGDRRYLIHCYLVGAIAAAANNRDNVYIVWSLEGGSPSD